jgi:hypothetical protein
MIYSLQDPVNTNAFIFCCDGCQRLLISCIILFCQKNFRNFNGINGTVHFKNVSNCLNTNIYSSLETYGACTIKLFTAVIYGFS